MPICLPKSERFPDTTGYVYVAGWGVKHESHAHIIDHCTTGAHGPNPFSKCKFPFKLLGDSIVHNSCLKSDSPTAYNAKCMELYKKMNRKRFLEEGYERVSENDNVFVVYIS